MKGRSTFEVNSVSKKAVKAAIYEALTLECSVYVMHENRCKPCVEIMVMSVARLRFETKGLTKT